MNTRAVTIFNSSIQGSSVGEAQIWNGGRAALVISANQYGGGVFLQLQSPSQKWISINGTTYSADQVTAYDLPAGQVRLVSNIGSSVNLAAVLVPVPYGG